MEDRNYLLAKKYILDYLSGNESEDELSFELNSLVYVFKENLLRQFGKNPFNGDIRNYKVAALNYLNSSYPYCFAFGGCVKQFDTLDDSLCFFARNCGANEEQVEQIIPMLQSINIKSLGENYHMFLEGESKSVVNAKDVVGSTVKYYNGDNLYDLLVCIDDKRVENYINYLMRDNVFNRNDINGVMNGVSGVIDEDGNLFVSEGNHRILTLKALIAIKEYITGEEVKVPGFNMTVFNLQKDSKFNMQ